MAVSDSDSRSDKLAAYQLGEAIVGFRWAVEANYLDAITSRWWYMSSATCEIATPPTEDQSFPVGVMRFSKQINDCTNQLLTSFSNRASIWENLKALSESLYKRLEMEWLTVDHLERLINRYIVDRDSDGMCSSSIALKIIEESPFNPSQWNAYSSMADSVLSALIPEYGSLFLLGKELAQLRFVIPSTFDKDENEYPSRNRNQIGNVILPRIQAYLDVIAKNVLSLDDIPHLNYTLQPSIDSTILHEYLIHNLNIHCGMEEHNNPRDEKKSVALQPSDPTGAFASDTQKDCNRSVTSSITSLEPNEDLDELKKIKDSIDPAVGYIGGSLPILRLFKQIQEFNLLPKSPLLILGPKGVGKTRLVEFIQKSSLRSSGPFFSEQAAQFTSEDPNFHQKRWYGCKSESTLPDAEQTDFQAGLLERACGGTIFMDELHSLDKETAEMLRHSMDGGSTRRSFGGEFSIDVRFIFATRVELGELEIILPPRVIQLLTNYIITVPCLNSRREDIFLFVQKINDNKFEISEHFLLALFLHDWSYGQVGELIGIITASLDMAEARKSNILDLVDIRNLRILNAVNIVKQKSDRDAAVMLYTELSKILRNAGYSKGNKVMPLQKRMAELLNIDEFTLSKRLKKYKVEL